jgi:tryptophan synthase alpha chain
MSRIAAAFADLNSQRRKGFIPFLTAGDPDLQTTSKLLSELAASGATLIELGVPFSDPVADGLVIQRASERALKQGIGVVEALQAIERVRASVAVPMVLFSYYNPLLQYGVEQLARDSRAAGVDGILVTDLPPEECSEFGEVLKENQLDMIFLVAPTTTDDRLELIAKHASGFIYAVSRRGVTGIRHEVSSDAENLVARIRRYSSLPVAVGFGISTSEQVADTWRYADAAVVGSAIVAEIESLAGAPDLVEQVGDFSRKLLRVGNKV